MTTSITTKDVLNKSNPNSLADLLQGKFHIGDILRWLPVALRRKSASAAGPYNLATVAPVTGQDVAAPASEVTSAYARAGGVTGPLTVVAAGTTPATGQIAVAPNGAIVTLLADAITDLDVNYQVEAGDVLEREFQVVSDAIALPTDITTKGCVLLMEVEATAGTATGKKIILVPGAGAPAAGQARLNVAKTTITFAAADAVTKARVKMLITAATDVNALLQETATVI